MKIQFSTSGSAFRSEYEDEFGNDHTTREECIRIISKIVYDVARGEDHGPIMDINGNKIGSWEL